MAWKKFAASLLASIPVLGAWAGCGCGGSDGPLTLEAVLQGEVQLSAPETDALRRALLSMNAPASELTVVMEAEGLPGSLAAGHVRIQGGHVTDLWFKKDVSGIDWMSDLPHLTQARLAAPSLTSLSALKGARSLRDLKLQAHKLQDLSSLQSCQELPALTHLTVVHGPLRSLDGAQGCALEELQVHNNQLKDLRALKELPRLRECNLSHNPLPHLKPLAHHPQLRALWANSASLSSLEGLEQLPQLTRAYVSHNQIKNLGSLQGLPRLRQLNLSHNQLTDAQALLGLPALHELDLRHNQLPSLPEGLEGKVQILQLEDNPVLDKRAQARVARNKEEHQAQAARRAQQRVTDLPEGPSTLGVTRLKCGTSQCSGSASYVKKLGRLKIGPSYDRSSGAFTFEVKQGTLRAFLRDGDAFVYEDATPERPGKLSGRLFESGTEKYILLEAQGGQATDITWRLD